MKMITKTVISFTSLVSAAIGLQAYQMNKEGVTFREKPSKSTPSNLTKVANPRERDIGWLTCSQLRDRTREFFKLHYSAKAFTPEVSKKAYIKYFQLLDPGKTFFMESDVAQFMEKESKLGDMVSKGDCSFIHAVHERLVERVAKAVGLVETLVEKPISFTTEEFIETNRKKLGWPKDEAEYKERWRKLIKFSALSMTENKDPWDKIKERIPKRYKVFEKTVSQRSRDEVNSIFLNAVMLVNDPHSSFMAPADEDDFKVAFSLQLVGIGATLMQIDGYTTVDSLLPGGVAARDGRLRKGDKIVAVDSGDGSGFQDIIDMDLSKAVQLIRGKKDTLVRLKVLRKSDDGTMASLVIDLKRDIVKLADSEAKSDILEIRNKKVGVINLPSFYIDYQGSKGFGNDYRSSAKDIERELQALKNKGVDGILVDLRFNGGGDLGMCKEITGQFIGRGSVVQIQSGDGDVDNLDNKRSTPVYTGPLGVLISKQSASASEIFAGAIQDYGRGLIMGNSRTYGKGTVQNVVQIPGTQGRESNGALKVTVSKFFRPSGKTNQEKGVLSDIVIPDILEVLDISEAENEYVLRASEIKPEKSFRPIMEWAPFLSHLKEKSSKRIETSKEFKDLFEKIDKAKKEKQNTLLSLKMEDKKDEGSKKSGLADNKNAKNAIAKTGGKLKAPEKKTALAPAEKNGHKIGEDKITSSEKTNKDRGGNKNNKGTAEDNTSDDDDLRMRNVVIRKNDIQLREAAEILLDAIDAVKKSDWTSRKQ